VLGVSWSDADLGVPARPRDVEQLEEPKNPIGHLARRLGRPITDFYEELADKISLDVLRSVPSFATCRERTVDALAGLGYKRSGGRDGNSPGR